ncbi:MAG: methionyl aminopeptidase [Phycisphaerales bacterium]
MGSSLLTNPAQADAAYAAAQVVVETHRRVAAFLKKGVTLAQVDQFVAKQLEDQGAKSCFLGYTPNRRTLPPFPSHACLSVNECVVHGTAGYLRREMREGDVLKVDIGVHYKGWIGDAGWTYVFGKPTDQVSKLMRAGKESLAAGCAQLKPGNRFRDFAIAVQTIVEKQYGFHLIRGMGGHGLFVNGKPSLHGPPFVANRMPDAGEGWEEQNWKCEVGTLIAVEPMIAVGTGILVDKSRAPMDQRWPEMVADGSMSVHYEHDVLITEKGPRILSEGMEELDDVVMG